MRIHESILILIIDVLEGFYSNTGKITGVGFEPTTFRL
jgi:hypothetical protein